MITMSKGQVLDLFRREAILFGDQDGIPLNRARELFGDSAIEHVMERFRNGKQKLPLMNWYGIGTYDVGYINLQGALIAATYNNCVIVHGREWKLVKTESQETSIKN